MMSWRKRPCRRCNRASNPLITRRRRFGANKCERTKNQLMIIKEPETVDLSTPTGPMRTYVYRPVAAGRYPGLVFFSEIFQVTAPIRRTAAFLAGHGFVVAVPEVYHELEPAGAVLAYDTAGAERGNAHKIAKEVSAY